MKTPKYIKKLKRPEDFDALIDERNSENKKLVAMANAVIATIEKERIRPENFGNAKFAEWAAHERVKADAIFNEADNLLKNAAKIGEFKSAFMTRPLSLCYPVSPCGGKERGKIK